MCVILQASYLIWKSELLSGRRMQKDEVLDVMETAGYPFA